MSDTPTVFDPHAIFRRMEYRGYILSASPFSPGILISKEGERIAMAPSVPAAMMVVDALLHPYKDQRNPG